MKALLILFLTTLFVHADQIINVAWDSYPQPEYLTGFRIHVGKESRSYDKTFDLEGADATGFAIVGLPPGEYFSMITGVSIYDGKETEPSDEITFTVTPPPPTGLRVTVEVVVNVEVPANWEEVGEIDGAKVYKINPAQ